MRKTDIPENTPHLDLLLEQAPDVMANGGFCIAGFDGQWLQLKIKDACGHYSRPDV